MVVETLFLRSIGAERAPRWSEYARIRSGFRMRPQVDFDMAVLFRFKEAQEPLDDDLTSK